jgi:hypothetical protein
VAATLAGPDVVSVTFPGLTGDPTAIVRVAVLEGAVHGSTTSATGASGAAAGKSSASATSGTGAATVTNTIGAVALTGATAPTPTAGPNLTSAKALGPHLVQFTFDQPLTVPASCLPAAKPSGTTVSGTIAGTSSSSSTSGTSSSTSGSSSSNSCSPGDFAAVTASGVLAKGGQIVGTASSTATSGIDTVTVTFPTLTGTPQAFAVAKGAVTGVTGLTNAPFAVRAASPAGT